MISSAERRFIEDGVLQDIRSDGRSCMDVRPYVIETNILPACNGMFYTFTLYF